jgi:hypothetical protein
VATAWSRRRSELDWRIEVKMRANMVVGWRVAIVFEPRQKAVSFSGCAPVEGDTCLIHMHKRFSTD